MSAKFIRLHECGGNDRFDPILINADRIEHFKIGNKGKDTFVKLIGDGGYYFVRESLDDIEKLLK